MKKMQKLLALLALMLTIFSLSTSAMAKDGQTYGEYNKNARKLKIAIMSDPHILLTGRRKVFIHALKDAKRLKIKTVLLDGDYAQKSSDTHFKYYSDTVKKYAKGLTLIEASGNHDLTNRDDGKTAGFVTDVERQRWRKWFGKGVYYDQWVGKTHVIVLGSDSSEYAISGISTSGSYTNTQLEWLKKLIEKDHRNRITTIVLTHYPIYGAWPTTVKGYYNNGTDAFLMDIVKKNKNVIVFTGHVHNSYKNNGKVLIYKALKGGMIVHAGALVRAKPLYLTMTEYKKNVYKLEYRRVSNNKVLYTFKFKAK